MKRNVKQNQALAFWNLRHAELLEVLKQRKVEVPEGATRDELLVLCRSTEGAWRSGSLIPSHYKEKYGATQTCGDELASVFAESVTGKNGLDLEALAKVQRDNGIDPSRWSSLNPGQQRMNTGNVLRGKIRRGEHVVIDGVHWNKPSMK